MRRLQEWGVTALVLGGLMLAIRLLYDQIPKFESSSGVVEIWKPTELAIGAALALGVVLLAFGTFARIYQKQQAKDKPEAKK